MKGEIKMDYIGTYDGMEVYKVKRGQSVGTNTKCLVVTYDGTIYLGGVDIGNLDPKTYKVLRYDKEIYNRYVKEQKAKMRRKEAESAPVRESVAETATLSTDCKPVGEEDFFTRIALEIEEVLKSEIDYTVGKDEILWV